MDRRAEPDCLRERGVSPGASRDFAPTQVRRRPAPTKRRWRSSSVPLGDLQRPCRDTGLTILSFVFIRVRLITQITIDVGAGGRLTRSRWGNPAFNYGFFRPNPELYWEEGG